MKAKEHLKPDLKTPPKPKRAGVDSQGEITCGTCVELDAQLAEVRGELGAANLANEKAEVEIAGLQGEIRSLSFKLEQLKRDKEAEMRGHDAYDRIMDLFTLWLRATEMCERSYGERKTKAHKRGTLTAERFFKVLPLLTKHGPEICQRAIIGRVYHHFASQRPNGSTIRYCEWERIFGNKGAGATVAGNFEESANRAPDDWKERADALMSEGWMATEYRWGVNT